MESRWDYFAVAGVLDVANRVARLRHRSVFMLFKARLLSLALLGAGLASTGHAATPAPATASYKIAPSSHIGFHIDQVGGDGLSGTITEASGQLHLDPADPARSDVLIILKAASVTTGQSLIDGLLHSDAVFDADNHPDITFQSSHVVRTGPRTARIEGLLTARGISRSEMFDVDLTEMTKKHAAFHVVGHIERSPYGMGIGRPVYADSVVFDMKLEGTR